MWTSFIGFMASGKSAVTGQLGATTSRPTICLDDLIVQQAGRSVPELFNLEGEAGFRQYELQALRSLPEERNLLVDTGGGIIETPEAVALLRTRGVVIWLDQPWELLRARLKDSIYSQRPLIERLGWAGLEALYRRRRPLYAAAADFRLLDRHKSLDHLARTAMLRGLLWSRSREARRS